MEAFKLLLVEDNADDIQVFKDTVARYMHEHGREIQLIECHTVKAALEQLDNSFDGAIVDMRLADEGNEGNDVIKSLVSANVRVPILVYTGTPDSVHEHPVLIGVHKKGEIEIPELLNQFWEVHGTGLTRIMGTRGKIEEALNEVYHNNLLPQKEAWIEYGKDDAATTESALLRHTLNHLLHKLNVEDEPCFPEEFYIFPPADNTLRTGNIVKGREDDKMYIVLSPACDLAVRTNGKFNTDHIMLVELEPQDVALAPFLEEKERTDNQVAGQIKNMQKNKDLYRHWLPKTDFVEESFANFRKLMSVQKDSYAERFSDAEIQVSPGFLKDIVARFSSYYARQGQPEIKATA